MFICYILVFWPLFVVYSKKMPYFCTKMETYDEFDDPSKLQQKYSSLMSEEEFETQASEETN